MNRTALIDMAVRDAIKECGYSLFCSCDDGNISNCHVCSSDIFAIVQSNWHWHVVQYSLHSEYGETGS